MALPVYPVAGQVQARAMQANNASADQFGGATAAAIGNIGTAVQQTGQRMLAIEKEEKSKADAAKVMEAYASAKDRLRDALYRPQQGDDPGGLYNRQLGDAAGIKADVDARSRAIFEEALGTLEDDDQKSAFDQMWQRTHEANMDSATEFEFTQLSQYREAAQTAALGRQLQAFSGDLEASLIAMTEGPDAATAFLNAGRNYDVLADPEASHKAVAAFVERYKGAAVLEGGSAGIQAALSGNTAGMYRGDAQAFLEARFNPMSGDATLELEPAVLPDSAAWMPALPPSRTAAPL